MTAACAATASTWLVLKFSSLVQMSLTLTGLIPGGKGACFGGEKNSLTRVPKVPKLPPQETARRLLTGRFFSGSGRKYSARLPNSPAPKEVRMKGASLRSRTLKTLGQKLLEVRPE